MSLTGFNLRRRELLAKQNEQVTTPDTKVVETVGTQATDTEVAETKDTVTSVSVSKPVVKKTHKAKK